ncbi:type VI secretion system Vgr family protein [Saccharicrinis sp. GN24d3]|uniref:type VI secretion system Vgr family protein n=1 Tax=Saccharicrinis sp. GN24d3 TaxID=3458416 RepID=UPI0040356487
MSLLSKIDVRINDNELKSFLHITVNQNLYGIDNFEIVCRYDDLEKLDGFVLENTKDFLGTPIVIQTTIERNEKEEDGFFFKGYVTEVQGNRSYMDNNNLIVISGGSAEIILNRKPTNRAFIEKNLGDIVNEVLKPYGLRSKVSPRNSDMFPYTVQYEESDLEFLKRLAIRYGEWFFFNGQEVVFGELSSNEEELIMGINLDDLQYQLRVKPVNFSLFANDPLKSDVYNFQSGSAKVESNLNLYGKHALKKSKELYAEEGRDFFEHLNAEETKVEKALNNAGETEEAVDAVNLSDISGSSTAGFLSAGSKVKIACPDAEGKNKVDFGTHWITTVQHYFESTLKYQNQFTAIQAETAIPENADPYFVRNSYQQFAKVTDNVDPEKLGRVKVSFNWMEDRQDTPWIKVVTPYGGKDSGFYFVPAIGSRVLVGFEDGDVEKPYCIGALFDKDKTPDSAWTGNHDDANAKVHAIRTQSGQTIELHDEGGSEKIRIYDTGGKNEITLDSANGEISLKASNKLSIQAKDIELNADNGIKFNATQDLEQSGMNVKIEAKSNADLIANAAVKVDGKASAEISSTGITAVKGTTVKLN